MLRQLCGGGKKFVIVIANQVPVSPPLIKWTFPGIFQFSVECFIDFKNGQVTQKVLQNNYGIHLQY